MRIREEEACLLEDQVLNLYRTKEVWKEGRELEFKSAQGGLPKDLWESYGAFANTDGGIILLGVDDDGKVLGVENPQRRIKEFVDLANNPNKCSLNLCSSDGDIAIVKLDGKMVVAIRVPRADCADRPIKVNNFCYLRLDEADKRCNLRDEDRLNSERLIVSRDDYSEDDAIVEGTTIEDIDMETLHLYRNHLHNTQPFDPWVGQNDIEFLTAINAYRVDSRENKSGLTLAGLLMFGSAQALDRWKPSLQLDYQEHSDADARWIDRITNDTTWPCNLYRFYSAVFPKLLSNIKTPFVLSLDMRREDIRPAHIAIREALANALIHAAYRGECIIKISKQPSGIIFENTGSLLLRKEQIMRGGLSRCRNKRLQNFFRLIGVVDKAGTGVGKIMQGWMEECVCPPQMTTSFNPEIVRWILPYVGLASKDKLRMVLDSLAEKHRKIINTDDIIVLSILMDNNLCGHADIKRLYPCHPADISKILSKLKRMGIVLPQGKGRATTYSLVCDDTAKSLDSGHKSLDSGENSLDSGHKSLDSGENSLDSGHKSLDSDENSLDSGHKSLDNGKEIMKEELLSLFDDKMKMLIKETSSKGRWELESILQLIPQICSDRYFTLHQLSILLNRNKEYIRNRYVQYLVALGKLQKRCKEDNDPNQAYIATKK